MTTDLIAQAEAALPTIERLRKYDWQEWAAVDVEDAAQIVAGAPALIARIRELEGDRDGWRAHWQDVLSSGYDMKARAEAAEAKLAEVEKERDKTRKRAEDAESQRDSNQAVRIEFEERALAAEATVATLTAQVEAMRGALEEIDTKANNGAMTSTYSEGTLRSILKRIRDRARAALTTENQNG